MSQPHETTVYDVQNTKTKCPEHQARTDPERSDDTEGQFAQGQPADLIERVFAGVQQCEAIEYERCGCDESRQPMVHERGHVHVQGGHSHTLPLATLLSLCLHSFTEGLPFADPVVSANLPFVAGVLMHKAPMAIALAAVLHRSHVPSGRSWAMLVVFACALPIGIGAGLLGGDQLGKGFLTRALALAIGMLLHISTTIIFETTPDHRFNAKRFLTVLAGATLAFLSMH